MFFEFKTLTNVPVDDKKTKAVKEHYITDAESFSECESLGESISNDGEVFAIFRSVIREIVNTKQEGDKAYKAKVTDVMEVNGKEKKMTYYMLVFAPSIKAATLHMLTYLEQGYDLRLEGVQTSTIIDFKK